LWRRTGTCNTLPVFFHCRYLMCFYCCSESLFLFQLLFVSLYREAVAFIAAHGYTIHITSLFILIVVLVVVQGGRGVYCGAWVHGTLNT